MQTGQQTHTHTNNCTGKISRFTKDLGYTKPNTCTENTNTQAYTHTQNLTAIHTNPYTHQKDLNIHKKANTYWRKGIWTLVHTKKNTNTQIHIKHTQTRLIKNMHKKQSSTQNWTHSKTEMHTKNIHMHIASGAFLFFVSFFFTLSWEGSF